MPEFSPRLDVLPEAQRWLWAELSAVPPEFTLYGGTALALHLGHRESIDFNFFGRHAIDVAALGSGIAFLSDAEIIQREKNTLSALVDRGAPVKVSFFGVPKLPCLASPLTAEDNGLNVASLLELAGTKASVHQVRAEAKDYIDMDALIHLAGVSLPFALAAAEKLYGASFNPEIALKALSYCCTPIEITDSACETHPSHTADIGSGAPRRLVRGTREGVVTTGQVHGLRNDVCSPQGYASDSAIRF